MGADSPAPYGYRGTPKLPIIHHRFGMMLRPTPCQIRPAVPHKDTPYGPAHVFALAQIRETDSSQCKETPQFGASSLHSSAGPKGRSEAEETVRRRLNFSAATLNHGSSSCNSSVNCGSGRQPLADMTVIYGVSIHNVARQKTEAEKRSGSFKRTPAKLRGESRSKGRLQSLLRLYNEKIMMRNSGPEFPETRLSAFSVVSIGPTAHRKAEGKENVEAEVPKRGRRDRRSLEHGKSKVWGQNSWGWPTRGARKRDGPETREKPQLVVRSRSLPGRKRPQKVARDWRPGRNTRPDNENGGGRAERMRKSTAVAAAALRVDYKKMR